MLIKVNLFRSFMGFILFIRYRIIYAASLNFGYEDFYD